jgi:hypothetical protein
MKPRPMRGTILVLQFMNRAGPPRRNTKDGLGAPPALGPLLCR